MMESPSSRARFAARRAAVKPPHRGDPPFEQACRVGMPDVHEEGVAEDPLVVDVYAFRQDPVVAFAAAHEAHNAQFVRPVIENRFDHDLFLRHRGSPQFQGDGVIVPPGRRGRLIRRPRLVRRRPGLRVLWLRS